MAGKQKRWGAARGGTRVKLTWGSPPHERTAVRNSNATNPEPHPGMLSEAAFWRKLLMSTKTAKGTANPESKSNQAVADPSRARCWRVTGVRVYPYSSQTAKELRRPAGFRSPPPYRCRGPTSAWHWRSLLETDWFGFGTVWLLVAPFYSNVYLKDSIAQIAFAALHKGRILD
jgi:hypothetical protein